jgi:hypothetical protein
MKGRTMDNNYRSIMFDPRFQEYYGVKQKEPNSLAKFAQALGQLQNKGTDVGSRLMDLIRQQIAIEQGMYGMPPAQRIMQQQSAIDEANGRPNRWDIYR